LGSVKVDLDLNQATNTYKMHVEGQADVKIATVTFKADTYRNAYGWPTPVLTGTASIGGGLSSLFTGVATFRADACQGSLSGKLGVGNVPGLTANISGSVKSNGTLTINGYTVNTSDLTSHVWAAIGKAFRGAGLDFNNVALAVGKNFSVTLADIAKAVRGAN